MTRIEFEARLQRLVGRTLTGVRYFEIDYRTPIDEAAHTRRSYADRGPDAGAQSMAELDSAVAAIGESPEQKRRL